MELPMTGGNADFSAEDALLSPQLLAVHRAIAHILHLSGARYHIDRILRSMEEPAVRSDGSTDLGQIVRLRAPRWID